MLTFVSQRFATFHTVKEISGNGLVWEKEGGAGVNDGNAVGGQADPSVSVSVSH